MKEKGIRFALFALMLWALLVCLTVPAMAAEPETAAAEGLYAQQSGYLEWFALLFSSVWALILQLLRQRK